MCSDVLLVASSSLPAELVLMPVEHQCLVLVRRKREEKRMMLMKERKEMLEKWEVEEEEEGALKIKMHQQLRLAVPLKPFEHSASPSAHSHTVCSSQLASPLLPHTQLHSD